MPSVPRVAHRTASALAAAAVVALPLLPAAAQAQGPAGSTVVGELVRAWPEVEHDDVADHAAEQPLSWVETADGQSVRVPTEAVDGLAVGSTVELTVGGEVSDPPTEEGIAPAREVIGASVVDPPDRVRAGTNEVTVALVAPGGVGRDAVRPEQVAAVVDGPVADFWSDQTGGVVDLHVAETHGWVDTPVGCGVPGELWDAAGAAVGFTPGPGKHLLLYLSTAAPDNCAYGLAEVGSQLASGGRAYVRDVLPSLVAHELGHNFGLGHSSALSCAGGAETGGCRTAAYRDHYDVMGASWEQVGTLNAVQAADLGTLPASAQRTLRADGSSAQVTLDPVSGGDGVRALRLVGHDGREYWLELRTAAGQDGWLGSPADRFGLGEGVLLRRVGDWPNTSLLLDPTPTAGGRDTRSAVPLGTTVRLAGGFAVTVTASDSGGATLAVASSASAASGPAPDLAPRAGTGTPDVLEGRSGTDSGPAAAATPAEAGAVAVPAPERAGQAVAPAAGQPEQSRKTRETFAGASGRAVVPASRSRSLVPVAAGAVLGGAAVLVALRMVRTRARR